jgi:hypothetical protein
MPLWGDRKQWVYITLGLIGSDRAKALLEQGCNDEDEFARSGAERAMDIMNDKPDSKGCKNEKECKDSEFKHQVKNPEIQVSFSGNIGTINRCDEKIS